MWNVRKQLHTSAMTSMLHLTISLRLPTCVAIHSIHLIHYLRNWQKTYSLIQEQDFGQIQSHQPIDETVQGKEWYGERGRNPFFPKQRSVYRKPTLCIHVLISATVESIPCIVGAMLMCDRIHQVSNSLSIWSQRYQMISRIRMTNFSVTQSLLLNNLRSPKQPQDACGMLLKLHQRRPYRNQPPDAHQPLPCHHRQWKITCQCWHLVLLVPSKARILTKGF